MKKKIFGADLYAFPDGSIKDAEGNQVPMFKKPGGNYYINIGKNRSRSVPKTIAELFIKPSNKRIMHRDGDRSNNAVWNLEYVSHTVKGHDYYYKAYHRMEPGTIYEIVQKLEQEVPILEIAKTFKVDQGLIYLIISERNKLISKNT